MGLAFGSTNPCVILQSQAGTGFIPPFIHPLTHTLIHPPKYSIHPFIYLPIFPYIPSGFIHLSILLSIHLSNHPSIQLLNHLSIHFCSHFFINPHPSIHYLLLCPSTHVFVHLCIHPATYPLIILSIFLSTHTSVHSFLVTFIL